MEKLHISGDFLMTKNSTQNYHLRWFYDFFRRPIESATNKTLLKFTSDEGNFSRDLFFKKSGIKLDAQSTHFWYDTNLITTKSLNYLKSYLGNSFIIGYELSENTKRILDLAGYNYLDIWLHPIRFLDDNFFAFTSNNESVLNLLHSHSISDDVYYLYADRMKVKSYHGWNKENFNHTLIDNSAVFIGQTLSDKAVCREGKMLNLLDFKEKFRGLCKEHEHVYYSQHPMLKGNDTSTLEFVNSFENASVTKIEGYKLLTSEKIKTIASISSSLVYESKFFSKDNIYFYRPIVPCEPNDEQTHFASIYEIFVSPGFWSKILSPVIKTNNCKDLGFFDSGRKIRDMLSLYYNSHVFDKVDFMYQELSANNNRPSPTQNKKNHTKQAHLVPNEKNLNRFKKSILGAEIISFDIFDTLIERKISTPSILFDLIEDDISSTSKHTFTPSFKQCRSRIKADISTPNGIEEIPLLDRYKKLCSKYKLECQAEELMDIELSAELKLCTHKPIGKTLYNLALESGKKVIYTTDIYLPSDFIKKLLQNCGYDNTLEIHSSYDYKVLKHTGNIYPIILGNLNIKANQLLHVGDNYRSDIEKSKEHGIKSTYVKTSIEIVNDVSPILKSYNITDPTLLAAIKSSVANKLAKAPIISNEHGFVAGDAYNFGYALAGPMFIAFAKSIVEDAIERKLSTVYFLARDGEIVKKAYDIIAKNYKHCPKSKYLLASRRSIRVSNLTSKEDIISEYDKLIKDIEKNPSPSSISTLLEARLGIKTNDLLKLGLKKNVINAQANKKKTLKALKSLIAQPFFDMIIANAKEERGSLTKYYESMGIRKNSTDTVAFVDIGHKGSLQKGISEIMGLKKTHGYYFATYSEIDNILNNTSHTSNGFLLNEHDLSNKKHPYIKYALIFETLFLNNTDSFVRIKCDGKTPDYLNLPEDKSRMTFSIKVHRGVSEFCSDICDTLGLSIQKTKINPEESISALLSFLANPNVRDANIFAGVCMENYFSGRALRYIVPPTNLVDKSGLWREGSLMRFKNDVKNNPNIEEPKMKKNFFLHSFSKLIPRSDGS